MSARAGRCGVALKLAEFKATVALGDVTLGIILRDSLGHLPSAWTPHRGKPPEFLKDWRFLLVGLRWWLQGATRLVTNSSLITHRILELPRKSCSRGRWRFNLNSIFDSNFDQSRKIRVGFLELFGCFPEESVKSAGRANHRIFSGVSADDSEIVSSAPRQKHHITWVTGDGLIVLIKCRVHLHG